jgi:hypothetical protein
MRIKIEFELRDLWIGVYWTQDRTRQVAAQLVERSLRQSQLVGEIAAKENLDPQELFDAFEDVIHMLRKPKVSVDIRKMKKVR